MSRTYVEFDSWKEFQPFFSEEFRIKPGEEPLEEYWEWTDYNVHLDRYIPAKSDKPFKIVLVHGGGGNGRLLSPMGVVLRDNGYECVAADMPGFGLTEIRKPNSYNTWIELVNALCNREFAEDGKPIVFVGISLGGMLSYHASCINQHVKALIVSSLADATTLPVQQQLSKNKLLGKWSYKSLTLTPSLTDAIKIPIKLTTKMWAMANDQKFVSLLKKDKVGSGSWVYLKFFRTLMETKPAIEPEDFTKCPLLFVQPEKDYIIPWEISKPFYDRLACAKQVVFLDNCGHIPLEEPGVFSLRKEALDFLQKLEE